MDIQKIQKGLLDSLWLDPKQLKPFSHFENISVKLFEQYFPNQNPKNAKYQVFYPLLRCGTIEFYGNKNYGLSPSCALFSNTRVLFTNIPSSLRSCLTISSDYCNSNFGIEVVKNWSDSNEELKQLNIPFSNFLLSNCLNKISSLETIINTWSEDKVIDSSHYYFFNSFNNWVTSKTKYKTGLYKKSSESYAQKTLKISENNWKIIPSKDYNIDAFSVAVIWNQIQNGWNIGIKYLEGEKKLILNNYYFPIIIERLLFINTLLEFNNNDDILKREYFITKEDFNILNGLFSHKIEII